MPKDLTLWVWSNKNKYDIDFDEDFCNAINDEVGWIVKIFGYEVLSSR